MKHLQLIVALALLGCLLPMPYGYYMVVRVVAMILFGIMSFGYFHCQNTNWYIACAVMAFLFQPFLPIPLGRAVWMVVDVVGAGILGYHYYVKMAK